jgi:hypothetical protein
VIAKLWNATLTKTWFFVCFYGFDIVQVFTFFLNIVSGLLFFRKNELPFKEKWNMRLHTGYIKNYQEEKH